MKPFQLHLRKSKGFTIIELLVGVVLFLGVSAGAYKVYTSTIKKTSDSQKNTKFTRGLAQFFERFRHQIENTLQLPNSEGTKLRVARPARCIIPSTDPETEIGWSLIPFPGFNKNDITATFTAIDPSTSFNESTKPNDAIRMVYVTEDSVVNYLLISGTPAVASPTTGTNPIILAGPAKNLNVGDFAVIADAFQKDLIRITAIDRIGANDHISHENTKSIWNEPDLKHNYGGDRGEYGQPTLFKVSIATYALDPDTNTLMKDSHIHDDDFVAPNAWSAGLKRRWEAVAPQVAKFQVVYVKKDGIETRTPQAGMPGRVYEECTGVDDDPSCGCGNELGNPEIKSIKINIEYTPPADGKTTGPALVSATEQFNPTVLKKGLPYFGVDNNGCEGDVLYNTNADGSNNNKCDNPACLCTDRAPTGICAAPCGTLIGPGGWGGGGGAG